jgi:mRNA-degrading endonuclease toxin of MazEF toxin-antitoxin module
VKRGEVWRYQPVVERPGQSTLRLIISADAINETVELPVVLGLQLVSRDPGGLLAVQVEPHGWASALTIEAVLRRRLVEPVSSASPEAMDAVDAALRAAQEL